VLNFLQDGNPYAPLTNSIIRAVLGGRVTDITIDTTSGTNSYREIPNILANSPVGGSGSGLIAEFNTEIDQVIIQNQGPYETLPPLTQNKVTGGSGFGAKFNLTSEINSLVIPTTGKGWYSFLPPLIENPVVNSVTIPPQTGSGATVNLSYGVVGSEILNPGSLYEQSPKVLVEASPSGNTARLRAEMTGAKVKIGDLIVQGQALGTAFQVIDDVLDYAGNADVLGKNLGDDLREGKTTLPLIIAMQRGSADDRTFLQHAIEQGDLQALDRIGTIIHSTGALEAAREAAYSEARLAIVAAEQLPAGVHTECLVHLASQLLQRDH
jgi:hypothetical protein